jgi:hypothetical protein
VIEDSEALSVELTYEQMHTKSEIVAVSACAFFANLAAGAYLRRQDPSEIHEATEKFHAEVYMDAWRNVDWGKAGHACHMDELPETTVAVVKQVCGQEANQSKCICNIAKAHSCHVGCRKLVSICPSECSASRCWAGTSNNGGQAPVGGYCQKYCSHLYPHGLHLNPHGHRYCGDGDWYEQEIFVDCTGCDPARKKIAKSPAEKKEQWTLCMADCFPEPTCIEMCKEGCPDCFEQCVRAYKQVVEPYWDMFKGSLQAVPLLDDKAQKDSDAEWNAVAAAMPAIPATPTASNEPEASDDKLAGPTNLFLRKRKKHKHKHTDMKKTLKQAQALGLT